MFNGYLSFGCVEIANAERTAAYARALVPRMQFEDRWDADGLGCILGDGVYKTPAIDGAPWFSEHRPASGKFLGLYPLEIEGIESDSTDVTITELLSEGGIMSAPRRRSKEFRVKGLMLAEDDEGMDAGMRWLKGALAGGACTGVCEGDSLSYLGYLPQCCDFQDQEKYPDIPLSWRGNKADSGWTNYGEGRVSIASGRASISAPCNGDGAQWLVTGLVTGGHYRLALSIDSSAEVLVSIGEEEISSRRRQSSVRDLTKTPWVLDFTATSDVMPLRVLNGEADCQASTIRVYRASIDRIAAIRTVAVPRFESENFREAQSWAWSSKNASLGYQILPARPNELERIEFRVGNPTASTVSQGAGPGPRRSLRGLKIGKRYSVIVNLSGDLPLEPTMETIASTTTSLGDDWWRVTFTATSGVHVLRLAVDAATPITSGSDVVSTLYYLRVDLDTSRMVVMPPDQSLPAIRELHGVTKIAGPTVIQVYPQRYGTMQEVEFTMVATRPSTYSALFTVPVALDSTTTLVPTGECSNGEPVRRNLFTNPYFENLSINGGVGVASAPTIPASTAVTAQEIDGRNQIVLEATGASNHSYVQYAFNEAVLEEGHVYTVSADLILNEVQTGSLHANARRIKVVNGDSTYETGYTSEQGINSPGRQRISVTFVYTGEQAWVRFYHGGTSAAADVGWTAILVEEGPISGAPFDGRGLYGQYGSYTQSSWEGAENASMSTYRKRASIVVTDPDCAPIPVAPQPPSITPDCPRDVTEWRRYWMEVPADLAGGWNESVPVLTITTREEAVRDVRIRFYPNNGASGPDAVSPCDFCGEFYISYIPPKTVFLIDGVNLTAMADVKGSGRTRAMHLVSDADYGPIQWPAMTCDMPYFVTIDIAPDEIVDLDVDLKVALKE